jgi:hypothetical protein
LEISIAKYYDQIYRSGQAIRRNALFSAENQEKRAQAAESSNSGSKV